MSEELTIEQLKERGYYIQDLNTEDLRVRGQNLVLWKRSGEIAGEMGRSWTEDSLWGLARNVEATKTSGSESFGGLSETIYTLFYLDPERSGYEAIVRWGSHTTLEIAISAVSIPARHTIKRVGGVYVCYDADGNATVCIMENRLIRGDGDRNSPHEIARRLREESAE